MNERVRLDDFNEIPAVATSTPSPDGTGTRTTPDKLAHTWAPSSLITLAANPPESPTIGGLLYPGKRAVLSGETESLKTWFALILAKAEMDAGYPVAWVDVDAMGSGEILSRLRALGVIDSVTDELFLYYEPSQRLIGDVLAEVCGEVAQRGIRLFVVDAFNPLLSLHGLDPGSTSDIETFWREVAAPITNAGAAPTLLDHVVKNQDSRGKYAYGSERKASGATVHIGFRLLEPFSRGATGRALLLTHKDRPGFLPRPTLGRLVLDSDGSAVPYRLEIDHSRAGDKFRPTFLMERVSEYLSSQDEAVPRKSIEDNISGKGEAKRIAIDVLVNEGYAKQSDGPRGAKLVEFIRFYREADDDFPGEDATSSRPRPDLVPDLRSTPSSTSSLSPPYGGEDKVEVDLVPSPRPYVVPDEDDAFQTKLGHHREVLARHERPRLGDPGYQALVFGAFEVGHVTEDEWHQADHAHRFVRARSRA